MNLFDIVILGIMIVSTMMGLQRGMIKLIIGLICFVVSLVAAYLLFPMAKAIVIEHVSNIIIVNVVSGVISYLVSTLFCGFVGSQLIKIVVDISGGMIDRLCGTMIGALRGLIISMTVFGLIAVFTSGSYIGAKNIQEVVERTKSDEYPAWLKNAYTYNLLDSSMKVLGSMTPKSTLESMQMPSTSHIIPEVSSTVIQGAVDQHLQSTQSHSEQQQTSGDLEHEINSLLGH